jgi:DNA-binding NtrC family response regulator
MEDIPVLADHFISEFCLNMGKAKMAIMPEAIAALQEMKWTGNIRQLRNVIERLIILCDGEITDADVRNYA